MCGIRNVPANTETYTLCLHDALPISKEMIPLETYSPTNPPSGPSTHRARGSIIAIVKAGARIVRNDAVICLLKKRSIYYIIKTDSKIGKTELA